MRGRGWSARIAALCVLLLAADVQAQVKDGFSAHAAHPAIDDHEARDLFRLGKQAYDEGRYERALKYFKDAYDLSGRAQLQFNIGAVLDRLRCDREAIEAYRSYLGQIPDAENRAAVEERIRLLAEGLSKPDLPGAVQRLEPAPQPTLAPPNASATQVRPAAQGTAAVAPTPEQTARATLRPDNRDSTGIMPASASAPEGSTSLVARWWFWTGIGAVAVGAVVTGVVMSPSSGGRTSIEGPAVLGANTRVRPL